jgi:hypothetical protein
MQILKHRRAQDGSYRLLIWLDESKTVEGEPDPNYVRRFDWASKPAGVLVADYVAMQKRETKLLCEAELAELAAQDNQGTAVGGEGEPL